MQVRHPSRRVRHGGTRSGHPEGEALQGADDGARRRASPKTDEGNKEDLRPEGDNESGKVCRGFLTPRTTGFSTTADLRFGVEYDTDMSASGIIQKQQQQQQYWLFKEEPTHYSFARLVSEGRTSWDGVTNNLALKNLRSIRTGDLVFFY